MTLAKDPAKMPLEKIDEEAVQTSRLQGKVIVALCDDTIAGAKQFQKVLSTDPQIFFASLGGSLGAILQSIVAHRPDVVIASVSILTEAGYHAIKQIREKSSNSKLICSRTPSDGNLIRDLLDNGIEAILGQDAQSGEYSVAIRAVGFGGLYVSREIATAMALSDAPPTQGATSTDEAVQKPTSPTKDNTFGLSQREIEVLHLVAKGLSSKQVAPIVGISARTVEAHRANIKRKTNAMGLSDLVEISIKLQGH